MARSVHNEFTATADRHRHRRRQFTKTKRLASGKQAAILRPAQPQVDNKFTATADRHSHRRLRRRQFTKANQLDSGKESSPNVFHILSPPSPPSAAGVETSRANYFLPSFIAPTAALRILTDNTLNILSHADAPNVSPSGGTSTSSSSSTGSTTSSNTSTTTTTTSSHTAAIVAVVVAVIVVVVIITIFIICRRRRLNHQTTPPTPPPAQQLTQPPAQYIISSTPPKSPPRPSHPADPDLPLYINPSVYGPSSYPYKQLDDATNGFDESRLLGKGGFGAVYKGEIDGDAVAVKRLDEKSRQGLKEFIAEVNIISNLRHRNLVKLRGWCYDNGHLFLVYEYVANGSLDTILFNDERCCRELAWKRRFNIICGLGSALQYLHEECETVIIHRDIKASNVLLNEKYLVKLGDFGLSRNMDDNQYTTRVAGTPGYIAPEVIITGKSNKESDVFSFGAVLAEVACGKRVVDGGGFPLVDWVWGHLTVEKLLEVADKRLGGDFNEEEMKRVLLVALKCSHPDPLARPSIRVAMDIVRGTLPSPEVPISKPMPTYATTPPSSAATSSTYGVTSTSSSIPDTRSG